IFFDDEAAVEFAVAVEIGVVVLLENVVGGGELTGEAVVGGRAFDEIISDAIELMVGGGMSAHEAGDAPVADDVVEVLNRALGLGVAGLVVNPEVVAVGEARP